MTPLIREIWAFMLWFLVAPFSVFVLMSIVEWVMTDQFSMQVFVPFYGPAVTIAGLLAFASAIWLPVWIVARRLRRRRLGLLAPMISVALAAAAFAASIRWKIIYLDEGFADVFMITGLTGAALGALLHDRASGAWLGEQR